MEAIILAAGVGRRLNPLTRNTPKCLLKVNSKTILEHQIKSLKRCGVQRITMVVGFKAEKIKDFCKEHSWNINFIHNEDYAVHTDNLFSLGLARKQFGRDLVCLNSDVLFDVEILERLLKCDGDICTVELCKEFMGIVKFSKKGTIQLLHVLNNMSVSQAKTMLLVAGIQKLREGGYKVQVLDVQKLLCININFRKDLMKARMCGA